MIAVLRGIGYDGIHIGGPHLTPEDIEWVIGKSHDLFGEWTFLVSEFDYPQPGGFYLYEKDPATGLNRDIFAPKGNRPARSVGYTMMRIFHRAAFAPEARLYGTLCAFFRALDGSLLERPVTELEYWIKFITSRCRRCGDCTLAEMAFLCPQSQCPKFLFNGQCGGSVEGWCEVSSLASDDASSFVLMIA